MAMGATVGADLVRASREVVISGSALGQWIEVNSDVSQTAHTTTERCAPFTISNTGFHWCRIPVGVTRVMLRARIKSTVSAITTSPVVGLVGAYKTDPNVAYSSTAPSGLTDGSWSFERLDSTTANAAGTTLTLGITATTTRNDTSWWYSASNLTTIDIYGAHAIGVIVTTAGAVTGADSAIRVDALLLN